MNAPDSDFRLHILDSKAMANVINACHAGSLSHVAEDDDELPVQVWGYNDECSREALGARRAAEILPRHRVRPLAAAALEIWRHCC